MTDQEYLRVLFFIERAVRDMEGEYGEGGPTFDAYADQPHSYRKEAEAVRAILHKAHSGS